MVYYILMCIAPFLSGPLEINGYQFFQIGERDFLLHNGTQVTILGSTNGRIDSSIMFVHMGQIEVGKKLEIEVNEQRYLLRVRQLKVNNTEVRCYDFTRRRKQTLRQQAPRY